LLEPPLKLLKRLLRKSYSTSSEAPCEGYITSIRVYRKIQSKVKMFGSKPDVDFLPAPVSLVKEWHQMMVIPMIRKVSTI
jgi:hypothetical protein